MIAILVLNISIFSYSTSFCAVAFLLLEINRIYFQIEIANDVSQLNKYVKIVEELYIG